MPVITSGLFNRGIHAMWIYELKAIPLLQSLKLEAHVAVRCQKSASCVMHSHSLYIDKTVNVLCNLILPFVERFMKLESSGSLNDVHNAWMNLGLLSGSDCCVQNNLSPSYDVLQRPYKGRNSYLCRCPLGTSAWLLHLIGGEASLATRNSNEVKCT